ncbi:MAG TPA: alpha-amylase family glycosyl hydrolase [Bacteroidota bacterium]|nr:alpha-amylase family glycosyl hydrolase [Bacteroidota bacterium]
MSRKSGGTASPTTVNPYRFFINAIDVVLRSKPGKIHHGAGGSWSREAVVYNMFVRSSTAFDHDGNGTIDLPAGKSGWRETGTFLKAIALLPYIRSLGVNTIHLLPITSIGSDGKKGSLGSPYAIKNPYELDSHLSEPNAGVGAEEEFKAFVEGAHRLGMRVLVEFVFRTSAKDGDWIQEHPEWYYWIRADIEDRVESHDETRYGNPHFTDDEMRGIFDMVHNWNFRHLPHPHDIYRDMFTPSPARESIIKSNGKWIGRLPDNTRVRIPGAFADWPPNDAQPAWSDVTYLKLYDHPGFNYIAYNTIRMYDEELARPEHANASLWDKVAGIVPYYQTSFGIDGVMIDMGHALPMELKQEMIRRARAIDPGFAFWDENFSVSEHSVREGYNAVIGYQWIDQHHPDRFKNLLRRFAGEGFPLPFFATPESHNTPRAAARSGGIRYSKYAWAVSNFLPAIPFIHSGFELGETLPVNTGLDFSAEALKEYRSEELPLFSEHAYPWTNAHQMTDWIRHVSAVRRKFQQLIMDPHPGSFVHLESGEPDIIAFARTRAKGPRLLVVANSSMEHSRKFNLKWETKKHSLTDLLTKEKISVRDTLIHGLLTPGQVAVLEV